nr:hypothetical protein HK105_003200 [Polyrhizophydium stewartii]
MFTVVALLQLATAAASAYCDLASVAGPIAFTPPFSFSTLYISADLAVSLLDAVVCVQIWRLRLSKAGPRVNNLEFARALIAIISCAALTVVEVGLYHSGFDNQWQVYFIFTATRIVLIEIFNSGLIIGLVDQPTSHRQSE